MAQVHSRDTSPEVQVRKAVHKAGYRFRLYRSDLPGKPDLVLARHGVVVFVHGCFWHGHRCKAFRMPSSNVPYWARKIARNVERDKKTVASLRAAGWRCRVIWACRLPQGVARLLKELARKARRVRRKTGSARKRA